MSACDILFSNFLKFFPKFDFLITSADAVQNAAVKAPPSLLSVAVTAAVAANIAVVATPMRE